MKCTRCDHDDFADLGRECAWPVGGALRVGWLCWPCSRKWLATDFGGAEQQPVNVDGEWTTLAIERQRAAKNAA